MVLTVTEDEEGNHNTFYSYRNVSICMSNSLIDTIVDALSGSEPDDDGCCCGVEIEEAEEDA